MATIKGVNVTKYDSPGGDNVVGDGFIKTVEKVWIDSYVIAAAIPSTTSLLIARVPKNKKVTDIVAHIPVCGNAGTNTTVYCGTGATTSASQYFGLLTLSGDTQKTTIDLATAGTLRLSGNTTKMGVALPTDCGIYLTFGGPGVTVTGGTIRTIVRYT